MTIKSWNNEHETPLPEYYKLHEDLGYMKVRSNPSVFREFSFSEKNNAHEYYYSKLLLYWHWRKEENDFHLESAEQCSRLFATKAHEDDEKTRIEITQEKIFPDQSAAEYGRAEVALLDDQRPTHIGDIYDGP